MCKSKRHPEWKKQALYLRLTTNLSNRAIGRKLEVPEATMRRFLNKSLKDGCSNIETVSTNYEGPLVAFFDLETAPLLAWLWGTRLQTISPLKQIARDWKLLCFSYKFMHEKSVYSHSLHHYVDKDKLSGSGTVTGKMSSLMSQTLSKYLNVDEGSLEGYLKMAMEDAGVAEQLNNSEVLFGPYLEHEERVVKELWHVLDKADIVVAHNAKRFDVKKAQAKFIEYGLQPTSPFKVIDTLKISVGNFGFTSHKLDYITQFLKQGAKLETDFKLWERCITGDYSAFEYMAEYCDQDIVELENVYNILAPWHKQMPNMSLYTDSEDMHCNTCRSTDLEELDKYYYTNLSKFPLYRCNNCGKTLRGRENLLTKEKRSGILMNT